MRARIRTIAPLLAAMALVPLAASPAAAAPKDKSPVFDEFPCEGANTFAGVYVDYYTGELVTYSEAFTATPEDGFLLLPGNVSVTVEKNKVTFRAGEGVEILSGSSYTFREAGRKDIFTSTELKARNGVVSVKAPQSVAEGVSVCAFDPAVPAPVFPEFPEFPEEPVPAL